MPRWPEKWIVVVNWPDYQSYSRPRPPWIKNHMKVLHKAEYLDLPLADKGLLHVVWLLYADWDGQLRAISVRHFTAPNTHGMRDREAARVLNAHRMCITRALVRLNHAGFIRFSASKPLSLYRSSRSTRARENKVCPFCETGGGMHTTDCPTLEDSSLLVQHLISEALA